MMFNGFLVYGDSDTSASDVTKQRAREPGQQRQHAAERQHARRRQHARAASGGAAQQRRADSQEQGGDGARAGGEPGAGGGAHRRPQPPAQRAQPTGPCRAARDPRLLHLVLPERRRRRQRKHAGGDGGRSAGQPRCRRATVQGQFLRDGAPGRGDGRPAAGERAAAYARAAPYRALPGAGRGGGAAEVRRE